jgi:hypothetical protein
MALSVPQIAIELRQLRDEIKGSSSTVSVILKCLIFVPEHAERRHVVGVRRLAEEQLIVSPTVLARLLHLKRGMICGVSHVGRLQTLSTSRFIPNEVHEGIQIGRDAIDVLTSGQVWLGAARRGAARRRATRLASGNCSNQSSTTHRSSMNPTEPAPDTR